MAVVRPDRAVDVIDNRSIVTLKHYGYITGGATKLVPVADWVD